MTCTCCHAPGGLHTADCQRAYKAAYQKAAIDASGLCEQIANSASTHSATQIALSCAESVRHLSLP